MDQHFEGGFLKTALLVGRGKTNVISFAGNARKKLRSAADDAAQSRSATGSSLDYSKWHKPTDNAGGAVKPTHHHTTSLTHGGDAR